MLDILTMNCNTTDTKLSTDQVSGKQQMGATVQTQWWQHARESIVQTDSDANVDINSMVMSNNNSKTNYFLPGPDKKPMGGQVQK